MCLYCVRAKKTEWRDQVCGTSHQPSSRSAIVKTGAPKLCSACHALKNPPARQLVVLFYLQKSSLFHIARVAGLETRDLAFTF